MGFGRGLGRWRARFAAPALSRIPLLAREALMRRGTCRARGLLTSYVLSLTVNILSYLILAYLLSDRRFSLLLSKELIPQRNS